MVYYAQFSCSGIWIWVESPVSRRNKSLEVNFQMLIGMCAEAHQGCRHERAGTGLRIWRAAAGS